MDDSPHIVPARPKTTQIDINNHSNQSGDKRVEGDNTVYCGNPSKNAALDSLGKDGCTETFGTVEVGNVLACAATEGKGKIEDVCSRKLLQLCSVFQIS